METDCRCRQESEGNLTFWSKGDTNTEFDIIRMFCEVLVFNKEQNTAINTNRLEWFTRHLEITLAFIRLKGKHFTKA